MNQNTINSTVEIHFFEKKYSQAFRDINLQWISEYFEVEQKDIEVLGDPQSNIIDKGGEIFVALYQGEVVGVCALLKMNDPEFDYELGKMAVSPKARGKRIGWLLGQAAVQYAKDKGASSIYLESNDALVSAINLYKKLGFEKITDRPSPYKRVGIQMALDLHK